MSGGNSLVNLGDASKPVNTLIERMSDAVGGMFRPWQIERVAKAEAKADLIRATSQLEISDIQKRAVHRWLHEEERAQENIESIAAKALPLVESTATPEHIEPDWMTAFFARSRGTSDKDMQDIWARVLAGEANIPGSYSKRTLDTLALLDKADAELFARLCQHSALVYRSWTPLIFGAVSPTSEFNYDVFAHLQDIGLVRYTPDGRFGMLQLPQSINVVYGREVVEVHLHATENNTLETGHVIFSRIGKELASVVEVEPIPGFVESVLNVWMAFGFGGFSSPFPQATTEHLGQLKRQARADA